MITNSIHKLVHKCESQYSLVIFHRFSQNPGLESSLAEQGYHPAFPAALPYLPAALRCYTRTAPGRFPAQRHQAGRLKEYYLLNAASLLPVLALEVKDGENVLDLCAAPGGKSVAILQCACPGNGARCCWRGKKQTTVCVPPSSVLSHKDFMKSVCLKED